MIVYRLASPKYSNDITGEGAALHGGRWNKKGTPILYTSWCAELALLEVLVNVPLGVIPELHLLKIKFLGNFLSIPEHELPTNWRSYPPPLSLCTISEDWVKTKDHIALQVPSSIIPSSNNYILNCNHPDYSKNVSIIENTKFDFDLRLLK